MSSTHEVISAFLDDEPFDPQELSDALSDPAGRALLIDLIALRRIVQPTDAAPAIRAATPVWRPPMAGCRSRRGAVSDARAAGIWPASDAP